MVSGQRHAPAAPYPRERPGTHCTGGWLGPRAGLDRCRKFRPHWDSIPGPSSLWPVAIPIELPAHIKDKGLFSKISVFWLSFPIFPCTSYFNISSSSSSLSSSAVQPWVGLGLFFSPRLPNNILLWGGAVSLTPNPQPGRPGYPFLSGSSPLTSMAWEVLPVAYTTASIALRIIWSHKPHHDARVGIYFQISSPKTTCRLGIPWQKNMKAGWEQDLNPRFFCIATLLSSYPNQLFPKPKIFYTPTEFHYTSR